MTDPRPLANDPDRPKIVEAFDLHDGTEWWLTAGGDYETGAAETMREDGSGWQRVVMVQWPARLNKTTRTTTLRLLISPEDALGLAEVLCHTAGYMLGLPPLEKR